MKCRAETKYTVNYQKKKKQTLSPYVSRCLRRCVRPAWRLRANVHYVLVFSMVAPKFKFVPRRIRPLSQEVNFSTPKTSDA